MVTLDEPVSISVAVTSLEERSRSVSLVKDE